MSKQITIKKATNGFIISWPHSACFSECVYHSLEEVFVACATYFFDSNWDDKFEVTIKKVKKENVNSV